MYLSIPAISPNSSIHQVSSQPLYLQNLNASTLLILYNSQCQLDFHRTILLLYLLMILLFHLPVDLRHILGSSQLHNQCHRSLPLLWWLCFYTRYNCLPVALAPFGCRFFHFSSWFLFVFFDFKSIWDWNHIYLEWLLWFWRKICHQPQPWQKECCQAKNLDVWIHGRGSPGFQLIKYCILCLLF